jgi:hypothetical protein
MILKKLKHFTKLVSIINYAAHHQLILIFSFIKHLHTNQTLNNYFQIIFNNIIK